MSNFKNKTWLEIEYVKKRKPILAIAQECGVGVNVIIEYLNEYGIYRKLPSCPHSKIACPKCG